MCRETERSWCDDLKFYYLDDFLLNKELNIPIWILFEADLRNFGPIFKFTEYVEQILSDAVLCLSLLEFEWKFEEKVYANDNERAISRYTNFKEVYKSEMMFIDDAKNTTLKCRSKSFGCFDNALSITLPIKLKSINI